jgi:nitrogen regulatory protein P-II 1
MTEFMNCIVAYIQPFQLERVVNALRSLPDFPGMSVFHGHGFGRLEAHRPTSGEPTEVDPFKPKVRIEIYCLGTLSTSIVATIRESARTGNAGDGVIFVSDLAWAYRIRDAREGPRVLSGHGGRGA